MNNNSVQLRHSIIYGAFFGGIIVFLLFILFMLGMLNNATLISFSPMIFIFGAYFSVKQFRDKISHGFITFGKAFRTSLISCLVMGVIWAIYSYILYKYLSPGLMIHEIEQAQELLLNKGINEKLVEMATSSVTPAAMAFGYVTNSLIYGSLLSLVLAAILKRNVNPLLTDSDQNL